MAADIRLHQPANRFYVASSWRNEIYPWVISLLRELGHEVYDFRANAVHAWEAISPRWKQWSPAEYRDALHHPTAAACYGRDAAALANCDACLLVLPSGRSASFELGWSVGQGKSCAVLMLEACEAELMYRGIPILTTADELTAWADG